MARAVPRPTGRPRPRSSWPTAARRPGQRSATRRWPRPTGACSRGRGGRRRPGGADRGRPARLVRGLRGRGDRPATCRTPGPGPSGARHAGLLTGDDLAGWPATYEAPATLDYHGYTVLQDRAWGQGPVFLQQLALLEGFDLAAHGPRPRRLRAHAWSSAPSSPSPTARPGTATRSRRRAARRRCSPGPTPPAAAALIGAEASLELRPGSPGRAAAAAARSAGAGATPAVGDRRWVSRPWHRTARRGDTCHLDVVDRWGNMVSATPSGGWLQSSPVVPELGFCLGTRARCSGWRRACRLACAPAAARGRRSPRRWPCATASPCWPSARPAATSRTSGRCTSSWPTPGSASTSSRRSTPPASRATISRARFWPRRALPGKLVVEAGLDPATIGGLRQRGGPPGTRWPTTGRSGAHLRRRGPRPGHRLPGRRRQPAAGPSGLRGSRPVALRALQCPDQERVVETGETIG